ncbi:MAG: DinB family protein, partial [Ignavibacteria bacterium]|nr:DinB family protein [Ignavibacteria bacterium]
LFKDASVEELNKKPSEKRWSAAECIEHLTLAGQSYLSNIPKIPKRSAVLIDDEVKIGAGLFAKTFIHFTGPKVKIKMKAPKSMLVSNYNYDKDVIDDFLFLQDEFLSALSAVNYEELKSFKVAWPTFELIKLSLGDVMMITIAHELRHINQAERALDDQ